VVDPATSPSGVPATDRDSSAREILRISLASFFALVTEPLFLLADSAIVGHLGTPQLAGLGIASAVLATIVSGCIFLAYGTTATVARAAGAGDRVGALTQGVDGIWLAVIVGALVTVAGEALTTPVVALFGTGHDVAGQAERYLHIAWLGAIPMLVMLAAVGVLRGIKDVRTPLVVAVLANLGNIAANLVLVYGPGPFPRMGLAGSALGSLIAQSLAAVAVTVVVVRHARAEDARLVPDRAGVVDTARAGIPLIVRTLLLRAALVLMTWSAARTGDASLAAMQLALSIWGFLAFALDGLGISAQTLVGNSLGAGDRAATRRLSDRLVRWGAGYGVLTGLVLLACATVLADLFTSDPGVLDLMPHALLVAAIAQPLAGIVFVLDGILIGAGDNAFLARAQAIVLAVFAPAALVVLACGGGLVWLWIAFGAGFMGSRAVLLLIRERGDAWMPASPTLAG